MEVSKNTVFYVLEVKDEVRGYNLKKVRRDDDEKICGDDGALLLVPTLALASGDMVSISELRQQGEAMERWTQTYDTPNGKVSVDIPIIVPEVENVPILQVSAVMGKDVAEEKRTDQIRRTGKWNPLRRF